VTLRFPAVRLPFALLLCGWLAAGGFGSAFDGNERQTAEHTTANNSRGTTTGAGELFEDEDRDRLRRVFGRHLPFEEHEHRRLYRFALQELNAGKTVDGLKALQRLIDLQEDRFVFDSHGRVSGIRRRVWEVFARLSAKQQQTYNRLFGERAQQLIREGDASPGDGKYRAVLRRYLYTTAAFEAGHRIARQAFNAGEYDRAVRVWERLQSVDVHKPRFTADVKLLMAVAYRKLGERRRAERLIAQLGSTRVRIGGRLMTPAGYFERHFVSEATPPGEQWRLPRGDRRSNGTAAVSVPFPQPRWTVEYAAADNPGVQRVARRWQRQQTSHGRSTAVINTPLVAGNRIIIRSFDGVHALERNTGHKLWTYPTRTSLAQAVTSDAMDGDHRRLFRGSRGGRFRHSQEDRDVFTRAFAANELLGTLTSDGRRVFFVDSVNMNKSSTRQHIRRRPRLPMRTRRRSPSGNRLIAIDLNQPASRERQLSDPSASRHRKRPESGESSGPPRAEPLWVLGGNPDKDAAKEGTSQSDSTQRGLGADQPLNPLIGYVFCGPPLPVMGRLYAVCEFQRQLFLLCLHPASGAVVWQQPLAPVDDSVPKGNARRLRSCTPVFSDGVLVCPTHMGFLIGVDPVTQTLLWAAFVGDDPDDLRPAMTGHFIHALPRSRGGGFVSAPVIHAGRVFCLPPHSDLLHCLDLHTGRPLWTAPREQAAYVGAADEGVVLLVGRRETRGLSVQDGSVQWSTRTGLPSGRGLFTGTHFLLPLQRGRIANIEVKTGRIAGMPLSGLVASNMDSQVDSNDESSEIAADSGDSTDTTEAAAQDVQDVNWSPGNLIPAGRFILSAESDRLRAFSQAEPQLALLKRRLEEQPNSPALLHTTARLALLLGKFDEAEHLLTSALKRTDRANVTNPGERRLGGLESRLREDSRRLLRELLFTRLQKGDGEPAQLLGRIQRLSTTSQQRARFLLQKAEVQRQRGETAGMLATVDELAALNIDRLFALPDNEAHLISLPAWISGLFRRSGLLTGSSPDARLQRYLRQRRNEALSASDVKRLERYLALFGTLPGSGEVRNELARRLMEQRHDQRAELLLSANRSSANERTAAVATELLFQLWTAHGLYESAAPLLKELDGRFAEVPLSDGRTTGREFAAAQRTERLIRVGERRRAGPALPVRHVTMSEDHFGHRDPELVKVYHNFRQLFSTPLESGFDVLDVGDRSETQMTVIHREAGVIADRITIPARYSYPAVGEWTHSGHYFSLGSPGRMHGVSLLERHHGKPFWTAIPQGFRHRRDMLLTGPSGTTFAVFQARENLIVADPGTGRLRWQRRDLSPTAGLQSAPTMGLFGDEQVLVVRDVDAGSQTNFTVYRTSTGESMGTRRLNISNHHEQFIRGRFLFYVEHRADGLRLRIWDPQTDRHLLDMPSPPDVQMSEVGKQAVAVLQPTGELFLIDIPTGNVRRVAAFEAGELRNVSFMKAFRDGGRLFVNIQRPASVRDRQLSFYVGDTFIPAEHVRGELYAFDGKTGRRLWKRTFPQASVLQVRQGHLPFLVVASRLRDRGRGAQVSLQVEAIDAATGDTLGHRENLFSNRLLHMSYDPAEDAVILRGTASDIRLHLHHRRVLSPGDSVGL